MARQKNHHLPSILRLIPSDDGGPEGTLLEPAPIVAKLLVERKYGRIFRLPTFSTANAPELNDEFEYIL